MASGFAMIIFVVVLVADLAHFSRMVEGLGGINVIAYDNPAACSGMAYACNNLGPGMCCILASWKPTLGFTWLDKGFTLTAYPNQACMAPSQFFFSGPGTRCIHGFGTFESARYVRNSGAAEAATFSTASASMEQPPEHPDAPCNSTVSPDAIVYTFPDALKGTWILKTGSHDAKGMFQELHRVPDHQKMTWLRRAGATVLETPGIADQFHDHL